MKLNNKSLKNFITKLIKGMQNHLSLKVFYCLIYNRIKKFLIHYIFFNKQFFAYKQITRKLSKLYFNFNVINKFICFVFVKEQWIQLQIKKKKKTAVHLNHTSLSLLFSLFQFKFKVMCMHAFSFIHICKCVIVYT